MMDTAAAREVADAAEDEMITVMVEVIIVVTIEGMVKRSI